ncbi:MAG: hypothetical protein R2697_11030 [Ilumatobacteraceae bacterium]
MRRRRRPSTVRDPQGRDRHHPAATDAGHPRLPLSPEEAGASPPERASARLRHHYRKPSRPTPSTSYAGWPPLHYDGVVELGDDLHRIDITGAWTCTSCAPPTTAVDLPDYPFEPHYAEVPDGEGTLRVHYLDEGPGRRRTDPVPHGEPSGATCTGS